MMNKKGIILISTMLLIFFLVLLSTAFVNVNTNNLRLTTNVRDQEMAVLAAMSGVHYAQMRLEQFKNNTFDNSWGGCTGNNNTNPRIFDSIPPPAGATNIFSAWDENENEGEVTATLNNGSLFKIVFACNASDTIINGIPTSFNNLRDDSTVVSRSPGSGLALRDVPSKSVHLIVVGKAGGVSRTIEVILRRMAFTDSSAFAGGNITIDIQGTNPDSLWYINSVDPFDNSVRANGNITGTPSIAAPSLGNAAPITNLVPAFDATKLQITFTRGNKLDPSTLNSNSASLGAIVAKSTINFGGGVTIGDNTYEDNESIFAKQQTGGVLYPKTESPSPQDLQASDFTPDSNECIYSLANGNWIITATNQIERNGDQQASGQNGRITLGLSSGPSGCASQSNIYIKDYMLRIPKTINIRVDGTFNLGLSSSLSSKRAKLGLGYNDNGYMQSGNYPIFHVSGGNMTIQGELSGEGGITAERTIGGGDITIEGRSVLSTDPTQGVAVFADGSLTINPISSTSTGSNTDFSAYKGAIIAANNASPPLSNYTKWLNKWGDGYPGGNKDDSASSIRDQNVGTALYNGTSTTITLTGGGTVTVSGNPMSLPNPNNPNSSATLGQYVRFKEVEQGGNYNDWLVSTSGSDYKTDAEVSDAIKERIDSFYSDRSDIEGQLKSKLENLQGNSKFKDDTPANTDTDICSPNCSNYKNYKDQKVLVSFKEYWDSPNTGKFNSTNNNQTNYQTNFNIFWGQSILTAGQTLDPQDAQFTGVIYTRNNLTASMGNNKFFVEGAIVARNGDISITNADRVQFLYNPEFLTRFVNPAGSAIQTRLRQVFWIMW